MRLPANISRIFLGIASMLIAITTYAQTPTRNGAIDLTSDEGEYAQMNHDGSGKAIGIQGGSFTVETWVKVVANADNDMQLFRLINNNNIFCLVYKKDGVFNIETEGDVGDATWTINFTSSTQFLNNWVHVAFVNNGSNGKLFINGVQVYSGTFTYNGNAISSFFPQKNSSDLDGKCELGGTAKNSGIKGKGYFAEARLWNTALSNTAISQYYDEEVNKSHPYWNNLKRYYHFSSQYTTNGTVYIKDVTGNYDATVADNANNTIKDLYPPVKPAAFNNTTFAWSFTAADCQTSNIPVNWINLRSSTLGYYTDKTVYYELVRTDNNAVLYSGANNTYTDATAAQGTKYYYKVRTYWEINGTKYYSDDQPTSDVGTIKMQYAAPSNLAASTDKCNNAIALTWDWSSNSNPPNWQVQRATNAAFTTGITTLSTSTTGSARTYTNTSAGIETNLYYKVTAYGTDANGCTVSGTASSVATGFTSQPSAAPITLTIAQNITNKTLTLSWVNPSGNNADSYLVRRTDADGTNEVKTTIALGTNSFVDNTLAICKTYNYTIATVNECAVDGTFSTTELSGNVSQDLSSVMTSLDASKAYYPDKVRLEWKMNGSLSTVDRFSIYRTKANEVNYSLIKVLDNDLIFDDVSAIGGQFYTYKVVAEATCNTATIYSNAVTDLGFITPYGVANGHVEYTGGNAVKDVTVKFDRSSGSSKGKSLSFDGNGDYLSTSTTSFDITKADFSVEAWVKTSATVSQGIFGKNDGDALWEANEKVFYMEATGFLAYVGNGCNYVYSTKKINDGQWHHIAYTWDYSSGGTHVYTIYVDGVDVTDRTKSNFAPNSADNTAHKFYFAKRNSATNEAQNEFNGKIDEIRLWSVARTSAEIVRDYKRVLNGNETGLAIYYRTDEGTGTKVYDASKTADDFNKRNATFNGDVAFSTDVPSTDQLGIFGITDSYGDYTVSYIPYYSGGETFKVTPTFGQHQFSPATRTIYVGDGSKTVNSLDFSDISFFTIQGKVTYKNSEVPVEGVSVFIDGKNAYGFDNKIVKSDANGNYSINVPIGSHYLSVEKDGHVFSAGYFPPKASDGSIVKYEFTEDLNVNFVDSTKVLVAGRFVGGTVQGDKPIGMGLSKNNVGVADLQFTLQKEGYDLDITSASIYNILSIQTDAKTGEYAISMIPEKWVISKASNLTYSASNEASVLDLSNSLTTNTDTNYVAKIVGKDTSYTISTYSYKQKLNFVIRTLPEIEVLDADGSTFDGDSVIVFTDQTTQDTDTLLLGSNSKFNYPVYQMGKTYNANVFVYEYYNNPLHPNGPVKDKVPVSEANITINDNIMVNPAATQGKTNASGLFNYKFRAGIPDLSLNGSASYTKTFEVNAVTDKNSITWRSENPYRAYVLGSLPLAGTDFITYGPQVPDFVVHDPPGTNSYAYVEKGSSFTSSQNWEFGVNTNSTLDNTLKKGVKYGTGGSVTGPLFMFEQTDDVELGLSITKEYTQTGEYIETTTFTDRIETSSDPNDVGSDADLYIGKAYNAYFSKSKNLKPLSKAYCVTNGLSYVDYAGSTDNSIVLGIMDGLVMDEGKTATHFIYSQRQIVNEVVPNLMLVRDQLLRSPKYQSNFAANNRYFGLSNDNPVLDKLNDSVFAAGGDTTKISYVFKGALGQMDSVAFVNQQIGIWLSVIALNEAEKVNATLLKNVSFDGSAGKISSEISQDITSKDNFKRVHEWKVYANSATGYSAAGLGFSLRSDWNMGLNLNTESGKSITNTLKFGYVLDESDEGDYYSVDVKTTKGTSVFSPDNFSNWINKREEWVKEMVQKGLLGGAFGGASFGTSTAAFKILEKFTTKASAQTSSRQNAYLSAALFTSDLGYHLYDMATMIEFRESIHNKMSNNGVFNISSFGISSPVFVRRGGASRCPYEGDELTSFYIDANTQKTVKLHTGTLQREVPGISAAPTIRTNVPESQKANFTLSLQNLSASGSNMWYKMGIVQSTNPDGAVILVDGLAPDGSFLIPAWGTVTKTLTLQKGKADVFKYDSIGVVLMSICQNDPTSDIAVIADTVYISAHFLPECSKIEIKNLQDNWVANYNNNNNVTVKLSGYDINLSTLQQIDFQYKTLSGTPITVKTFFKDTTSAAYKAYSSDKGKIAGSETTLNWDISALTDRQYQLRARAICTDGSIYETPYISGIIDRITPTAFGTTEPTDGIYGIGDDISLTFNETIETGLVRDNNIKVRAVLNGSAVSHATYLNFAGSNTAYANGISFNNKSFTTEFWLKRNTGSAGIVFSKGAGSELTQFAFDASGNVVLNFGINTYTINPKSYYNNTYPENAWHHWAVAYDKDSKVLNVYLDDQTIKTESSVTFSAKNSEILYVGYDGSSNKISANIHELRIWDKALINSESYATMSTILSGDELNLYAYWPMDEATGSVAFDKAGARTLNTTATWGISPGGFAYDFNGAQYLSIPAQNVNITNETDFTLEFWFKGNKPSGTSTLFSSGKGDGNEVYVDGQKCLSITANNTGVISVLSNGKTFNAVTKNYFDNQWHHFALSVSRKGNTKAFVDGDLQNSTTSSTIYGLAESTMLIGARMSRTDPVTVVASQIFTGSLDEVRIWNTARNQDLIKLYKKNKLTGAEDGLVGYYPFDKYTNVMGAYVLQSTLEDRDSVSAGTAVAKTTSSFSSVTPAIRDVRPLQDIPFNYVVSNNKIIITPRVDAYKIEGQTLEISVSDIQDLYGNRMLSTQSWTAFVERNSIKWQQSEIYIEKNPDTSKSFTATIANLGGTAYDFTLENVPAWLTPSITQGTLNANSTKTITFKVSDAINTGYYEQGINLSTINGFNEKLTVKVRVAKTPPTWSVNENNYQFTANVFGKLKINGVYSTDTYDKVAAFINGECRGVANVEYVKSLDAYEVFINIYSNEISNETVIFKVWDASDGSIHEIVTPNLLFAPNKIWGTSLNPIDIIADESISSTTILKKGWNWISVNLNTTKLATVDSLFAGIGTKADIIKGQKFYDQYDLQTGWLGTLTFSGGVKPEQMYKVFVAKEDTLKVIGKPFDVNTTNISVDTGWSYIGYVPQVSMTVKEALSSVNFVTNDVVKSQNSFAMFSGSLGWIGSLKNMVPTKGYMLSSKNKATITYPERSSLSTARTEEEVIVELPASFKYNENAYPSNMALVATIANATQTGMLGNEILLAFIGDECRGFASPTVLQDGSVQYYILVQGVANSEQISFKLYSSDFSKSFRITNAINYKNDIVVGRTENAYELFVNVDDSQVAMVDVYPNPFETSFAFVTNLQEATNLTLKIYNTVGIEVFSKQISVIAGIQKIVLNDVELSSFATGVYTLKIVSDSFNETKVLVKK